MHKVISAEPLSDFRIALQFEDGLQKIVNIKPFICKGISTALEDEAFFRQVAIESGGGFTGRMAMISAPTFSTRK